MKNCKFIIFLALIFFANFDSFGKEVIQAKVKSGVAKKVSVTGAVFVRDSKYPQLGEAYKDPSGLIWGEPFEPQTAVAAGTACQRMGFRSPTIAEFMNLAKYLGIDSEKGYSPRDINGTQDILPLLSGDCYFPYGSRNYLSRVTGEQVIFCGDKGEIHVYGARMVDEGALNIICVGK